MIDQIIIGDKASFDDFGASVARRSRKQPPKKSIKETVPFSNITYDFTKINGEIYWEEGEHEYVFEMTAPTAEKLEEMKTTLSNWLMNIIQEELHDPLIPDYHYIVTYEDMSFEDDEGMDKTTATVVFSSYPYKISNYPKVYEFEVPAGLSEIAIMNESSHKVTANIQLNARLWIHELINGKVESIYVAQPDFLPDIPLRIGLNEFRINNTNSITERITFSFNEEVF